MAKQTDKDLAALIDEWAPQIEKTLNQLATKGPKLMNKGRKLAKGKGVKVPPKHSGQAQPSALTKKLVVVGGLGALLLMAVRRVLGAGGDWQVDPVEPAPPAGPADPAGPVDSAGTEEVEPDLS